MKLTLFIGPHEASAARIRRLLQHHKETLKSHGIETPTWAHVRLYTAAAAPDAITALRHRRGLDHPLTPDVLRAEFEALLTSDVRQMSGRHVVVAAAQIGSLLSRPSEAARLAALLQPHFDEVRLVAHVQEQARAAIDHYEQAVLVGRQTTLEAEHTLLTAPNWGAAACLGHGDIAPDHGVFDQMNTPLYWLDYRSFCGLWDGAFGGNSTQLEPLDMARLCGSGGLASLAECLNLPDELPASPIAPVPNPASAASLTRMRHMNVLLERYSRAKDLFIPHEVRDRVRQAVRIDGPPINPGSLSALSERFFDDNRDLIDANPALASVLHPNPPAPAWREADPRKGFRASQYMTAFAHAIDRVSVALSQRRAEEDAAEAALPRFEQLCSSTGATGPQLLNRVRVHHRTILTSGFRPHDGLDPANTSEEAAFPVQPGRASSGTVIIACMKNEAPYILEWIAHHLSIGVDHFLIYTNDCSDGTEELLKTLQNLGVVTHRKNDDWKGKSPQQHALNRALDELVVQNAKWIAHIDVDEFINVRVGDGTLEAFFAAVPQASHIAMTWRLFGHNNVETLHDGLVLRQFDTCAPSYCPKPHTAWGFKTLFRNTGSYGKLSCHRPNKLKASAADEVVWVNGSGQTITSEVLRQGWRSTRSSIGYSLLQLNHYPLRSAEAFLIKRDRGRALHVDRTIGMNYWIRMDWSDCRETSIQRNLPRLVAKLEKLKADPNVLRAHQAGFAWHKAKAAELRTRPEFADLFGRICDIALSAAERAAFALALDFES